jgi:hypothetical protein
LLFRLCNQTCMCSQINFTPDLLIDVLMIIHRLFFLTRPHSTIIPFCYNFRVTIILHPAEICITILPISWIAIVSSIEWLAYQVFYLSIMWKFDFVVCFGPKLCCHCTIGTKLIQMVQFVTF